MNLMIKAFNNLTTKQKEVWALAMQDFRSEYETARMLGLTRDCVHDRLTKAKRRYIKFIKENK